jgi:hypothetical protein
MSKIVQDVLTANRAYAARFGNKSTLPMPPGRQFAILTCMDARLDPAKYAGLAEGDEHQVSTATRGTGHAAGLRASRLSRIAVLRGVQPGLGIFYRHALNARRRDGNGNAVSRNAGQQKDMIAPQSPHDGLRRMALRATAGSERQALWRDRG